MHPNDNILSEQEIDEGWKVEDRPFRPGITKCTRYKGEHTDSCLKTEYGWLCNDICKVKYGNPYSTYNVDVSTLVNVRRELVRDKIFKYKWKVIRVEEKRKFRDSRSFKKDIKKVESLWASGNEKTKYKAKKKIIEFLDSALDYEDYKLWYENNIQQ